MRLILPTLVLSILVACGSDGSTGGIDPNADPRCAALCTPDEPPIEGAGDICSTASASSCVDQCEVRIAGLATVCQTCLLEQSYFGTQGDGGGDFCDATSCTVTGRGGSCTYQRDDQAMREACYRQVDPRREVTCDPDFRSVTECSSVCS